MFHGDNNGYSIVWSWYSALAGGPIGAYIDGRSPLSPDTLSFPSFYRALAVMQQNARYRASQGDMFPIQ